MFNTILKLLLLNPFVTLIVLLQCGAFIWSLFAGDLKTGVLMLLYGAANGILIWWR